MLDGQKSVRKWAYTDTVEATCAENVTVHQSQSQPLSVDDQKRGTVLRLRGGAVRDETVNRTFVNLSSDAYPLRPGDTIMFEETFSFWSPFIFDPGTPFEYNLNLGTGVRYITPLILTRFSSSQYLQHVKMLTSFIVDRAVNLAPSIKISCVGTSANSFMWLVRECRVRVVITSTVPRAFSNALEARECEDESSNALSTSSLFELL